jgi:hypothetical protein
MFALRGAVRYVVSAWLVWQIAALAVPFALCCAPMEHDDATCCPGVAPGQVCPMHHTREGDRSCKMRDACAHRDAMFLALTVVGILPTASDPGSVPHVARSVPSAASSILARAVRPDRPPPRSTASL